MSQKLDIVLAIILLLVYFFSGVTLHDTYSLYSNISSFFQIFLYVSILSWILPVKIPPAIRLVLVDSIVTSLILPRSLFAIFQTSLNNSSETSQVLSTIILVQLCWCIWEIYFVIKKHDNIDRNGIINNRFSGYVVLFGVVSLCFIPIYFFIDFFSPYYNPLDFKFAITRISIISFSVFAILAIPFLSLKLIYRAFYLGFHPTLVPSLKNEGSNAPTEKNDT